jgi:hypothetical protein
VTSAILFIASLAAAQSVARGSGSEGVRATDEATAMPPAMSRPTEGKSSPLAPPDGGALPTGQPSSLRQTRSPAPFAFGLLLNPASTALSILVNKMAVVSPLVLLGTGRTACLFVPQAYASTRHRVGGAGAQVGFRVFSRPRYDGLYFGVRFGGGVGTMAFKTFMGEMDAGWLWAFGVFRLGLGVNAGGGYYAYEGMKGSLYLFSVDLSVGFAVGRLDGSSGRR